MLSAEIISIGDELTSGQRLDTNSAWLSQQLADLGVHTKYHTTVADDLAANARVFRAAVDRADIVVATGGLGPTADDLTREALAQVAGVTLQLDLPSLEHIRQLFARHNRTMPERNVQQAMFPVGSRAIFNPGGTAPGIDMLIAGSADDHFARVFALPGVPAEMHEMFTTTVAPAILQMQPSPEVICHRRLKCFGAGESQLESMLPGLIDRGRIPSVGITVHEATITLRISAAGATAAECYAAMEPTIALIRQSLGNLVFGEEDDELEDAVVRQLSVRRMSLATVEFGTGGLLANWLSRAADGTGVYLSSHVFCEPPDLPAQVKQRAGFDSNFAYDTPEFVADLAQRWRSLTGCDFTLAVGAMSAATGAGTGVCHLALAAPQGAVVPFSSSLAGHPAIWRPRTAKQALNLLRKKLLDAL
jgi:nicotinamide-nucleotide amidase